MSRWRNYFLGGHTCNGFHTVYDTAFPSRPTTYMVSGPQQVTSVALNDVLRMTMAHDVEAEVFHSPSLPGIIDAIFLPDLNIVFFNEEAQSTPRSPSQLIDVFDEPSTRSRRKKIHETMNDSYVQAYASFQQAKEVHMQKESIYLSAMSFEKADHICEELAVQIFGAANALPTSRLNHASSTQPNPNEDERNGKNTRTLFFGAATPHGVINYIDNITQSVQKRYIIKGRSGSGKSTMMTRLGKNAEQLGLSVTYFLCGFDPDSIDMIIIPERQVAVLDGTAPHVIDPSRPTDEVIDTFERCIDPRVEEEESNAISEHEATYKHYVRQAVNDLRHAWQTWQNDVHQQNIALEMNRLHAFRDQVERIIQR